jgi:hypothetical protein
MIGRQPGREPTPLELSCGRRPVDEQDGLTIAHHGVPQRQAIMLVGARVASTRHIGHHFLQGHVVLFLTAKAGPSTRSFTYPIPTTPTKVYLVDHHVLLWR